MAPTDNPQLMTQSAIDADVALLWKNRMNSQLDGGRTTMMAARNAAVAYASLGGDARLDALIYEMKRRGTYDAWIARNPETSFYAATLKPLGETIATVAVGWVAGAAAIYGVGLALSAAGSAAGVSVTYGTSAAEVGAAVSGASVGATAAAAPVAASGGSLVTSAQVAAAVDAAGVAASDYILEAGGAAILAAAKSQKPSQAPPVSRPPEPVPQSAGVGLVATLAALGAVLLLPLP